MARIADVGFGHDDRGSCAALTARRLSAAVLDGNVFIADYPELLQRIAKSSPDSFLDEFVAPPESEEGLRYWAPSFNRRGKENPMLSIADDDILEWCESDPSRRYAAVIASTELFELSESGGGLAWRPIVDIILEKAPNLERILQGLVVSLWPTNWSGSRADIVEARLCLMSDLRNHANGEIASLASGAYEDLQHGVARERVHEEEQSRNRFQGFE